MIRRPRLPALTVAILALLFGVGMASAAFACEAEQTISVQCADSECDAQSIDHGCVLAGASIAPGIVPPVEPALSLFHRALPPSAGPQYGLASRPIGPEPPPPRRV
jgi:hypothetical protein